MRPEIFCVVGSGTNATSSRISGDYMTLLYIYVIICFDILESVHFCVAAYAFKLNELGRKRDAIS